MIYNYFLQISNRCNERIIAQNIRAPSAQQGTTTTTTNSSKPFETTCPKCQKEIEIVFYPHTVTDKSQQPKQIEQEGKTKTHDQVFAQIEMNGCIFWDILPSTFQAICFECSHANMMKNIKLKYMNEIPCEKCHKTMYLHCKGLTKKTFAEYLDEQDELEKKAKKRKHNSGVAKKSGKASKKLLGIQEGQPLPKTGTCKHYKHSHRWMRFPCCGLAFPCDECHDLMSDHPSKWANRMICGYCSKESNVGPRCNNCDKNLTKKLLNDVNRKSRSALKEHQKLTEGKAKKKKKKEK